MESRIFEFLNFNDFIEIKIAFLLGLIAYLIFIYKARHSHDYFLMAFPVLVFASFLHFDAIKTALYQPDGNAAYGLANLFIEDNHWNMDEFTEFYKRTQTFFYIVLFLNSIGFAKRMIGVLSERNRKKSRYYF